MNAASGKATRVILADAQGLVRSGIRALLEALPHTEVVAETGDGHELVRASVLQPVTDEIFHDSSHAARIPAAPHVPLVAPAHPSRRPLLELGGKRPENARHIAFLQIQGERLAGPQTARVQNILDQRVDLIHRVELHQSKNLAACSSPSTSASISAGVV